MKSKKNEVKKETGQKFVPDNEKLFSGIINHIQKNKSENEINITSSSTYGSNYNPTNSILYESRENIFCSENKPNSWICFDFKDHFVIPTDYTIRTPDWWTGKS